MSSTVLRPGHIVAERYRIEQLLGQGGMGSVYRASQLSMERTVALKLLVEDLMSPPHVERFQREAVALSRLVHPNTVRLFDFGTEERGCPFLVMEYLEGMDLAQDLEQRGPMRWDHALSVAQQVLGSLGEAHELGIVHRDIKPANIFLCSGPRWPAVKVLDFGIAGGTEREAATRRLTLTGTVMGSAAYMSPEQAQGKQAGPGADLYGVGVVLFEMLTGRTPFDVRVLTAQLLAKVMQPAPRLHDVRPELDVPAEVQTLVDDLLDRDASRRPASARAAADRIEALLARASLPPLVRSEQRPSAQPGGALPQTQLMLVPHTIDEGWAPPRTQHAALSPRGRPRPARRLLLAGSILLAGGASAVLVWSLEPHRWEHEPSTLVTRVMPGPESAEPVQREDGVAPNPGGEAPANPATELTVSPDTSDAPESPDAPPGEPASERHAARGSKPRASAGSALVEPEPAPAARASGPHAPASEPGAKAAPAAKPRAAWTVASAKAAEKAGEITPARRNEIIGGLRQRRLDARARAARDYKEGRISLDALKQRQREIEREIEGP